MPLRIKPHTAQLQAPRLSTTDKGEALPVGHVPDGPRVACAIAPISTEAAFSRYGVEVKGGYQLLCELEDAPQLPLGTLIWWAQGGKWLKVAAPPQENLAHPLTQHAKVLLSLAPLRGGKP